MHSDLTSFWGRLQTGIDVAVTAPTAEKLLGVRDGFLRYFHDGLDRPVPVAVVQQRTAEELSGLALSDEETIQMAREQVRRAQAELGSAYPFYVGCEGGLHSLELDGEGHHFVRVWAVIAGVAGEAWGASGSLELPGRLIEGLDGDQIPFAVPGTRRSGGMIGSLTGRLETQRSAVAAATFHALSTLLYGILESRPVRGRHWGV